MLELFSQFCIALGIGLLWLAMVRLTARQWYEGKGDATRNEFKKILNDSKIKKEDLT